MWIFLISFALQIAVVEQSAGSWHFAPSANDTGFYVDWARHLRGETPWKHNEVNAPGTAFYGMPGYAYLLAGVFSATGGYHQERSPVIVALLQAIAQAGTATVLFLLGKLFFSSSSSPRQGFWLGALAAALWILLIPAQIFSEIALPVIWVVFGFWALLYPLLTLGPNGLQVRHWLLSGLVLGLLASLAATVLLLLALYCVAIISRHRSDSRQERWRKRLSSLGLLLAGLVAGASPCWIHNFVVAQDPVLFSAHDGVNFYIGNHSGANGYTHIPPELPASQRELLESSIQIAEREQNQSPLPRSAVSHFWKERALLWITRDPLAWLRLEFRKFDNFWNGFEYDDLSILRPLQAELQPLPGIRWAHLAPFALAGLLSLRRWPALRWAAGAVLVILIGLLPVFITERYRLLAAPGIILLAVGGWAWLWEKLRRRAIGASLAYAAVLAAAAVWTTSPRPQNLWSLDLYNEGVRQLEIARTVSDAEAAPLLRRAQEVLEMACAYVPKDSNVLLALGNLWLQRGQHENALRCLQQAVAANEYNYRAQGNLGHVYGLLNRWDEAIPPLEEAASLDPDNPQRWLVLAKAEERVGRLPQARKAVQIALMLKPGDPELLALAHALFGK